MLMKRYKMTTYKIIIKKDSQIKIKLSGNNKLTARGEGQVSRLSTKKLCSYYISIQNYHKAHALVFCKVINRKQTFRF